MGSVDLVYFESWELVPSGAADYTETSMVYKADTGDLDALELSLHGELAVLWVNNGQGDFETRAFDLGFSARQLLELGDLDGDGDLEVFVVSERTNQVWINDGKGKFADTGQRPGDFQSWTVSLVDFDEDGCRIAGRWHRSSERRRSLCCRSSITRHDKDESLLVANLESMRPILATTSESDSRASCPNRNRCCC